MGKEILKTEEVASKRLATDESKIYKTAEQPRKKFYIVLARGGHCGRGYFVPMVYRAVAYNKKEAISKARDIPRVKHDQQGGVILAEETNFLEFMFVSILNDHDPYLITNDSYSENLKERRVRSPLFIDGRINSAIIEGKDINKQYCCDINNIKTAEEYADDYPLQQALAPRLENGVYVFPKNIDFHNALKKYYTATIKNLFIPKILENEAIVKEVERAKILGEEISQEKLYAYGKYKSGYDIHMLQGILIYYKLYGKNNPLGIVYDKYKHQVLIMDPQNYDWIALNIPQGPFAGRPINIGNPKLTFFNEDDFYSLEGMIFSTVYTEVYGKDEVVNDTTDDDCIRSEAEVKASGQRQIEKFNARFNKAKNGTSK